ncbi:amidohydrolase [Pseudoruegeria sp. HB172150]|uniref:amidohydrolase n=1 Tax=Pseudoruegeria sp. HB172150 TaxID=2721164 RepID=UPI001556DEC0|nr:amidohydrolase [Pseudoruegeria sp. HB172150]
MTSDLLTRVTEWRHHLHAHPELSSHEAETGAFISARLTEMGIEHETGIGGHGVVARLHRPGSNRSVGLRADIDALPIQETNSFAHASTNPGVMHACGHDGHTAALLGIAEALSRDEDWSGTIHLIFQPAEENGEGAKAMIADRLFERFPCERVFAWHNWPGLELGKIGVYDRPAMAVGGEWTVVLRGEAGHAAMPHDTRDPVTAAAHLIVALNSVVSRNVDPMETVALTCSTIHGGTASNQIPGEVTIKGTLRTFNPELRKAVIARMSAIIEGTAAAMGVEAIYDITTAGKVMADTPEESALSVKAAEAAGLKTTRDIRPVMGGDDFAFMVDQGRGGSYVMIGNGPVGPDGKLHESGYDFNDAVLGPAISFMTTVARMALKD